MGYTFDISRGLLFQTVVSFADLIPYQNQLDVLTN